MNTYFWASRLRLPIYQDSNLQEKGQTTAEYALVLLAAGTIAMLVVVWAQGNNAIGSLLDDVMSRVTSLMT